MTGAELFEYAETSLLINVPKAKAIKSKLTCPIHHRKILFQYYYLDDGTHADITRYCCKEHAQRVAQAFEKAQLFDNVYIEDQADSVSKTI